LDGKALLLFFLRQKKKKKKYSEDVLGLKNRLKTNNFESGHFIRHSIALNTCFAIKAQNKPNESSA
jgi:hypothetical protein